MPEFIFMLTHQDVTVPDALSIYDTVGDSALSWVGFKDVGQPVSVLRALTDRIHADGRKAVLEVVSVDQASEIRSVRAGLDIGVDLLMGGTRHDAVLPIVAGRPVRYFPFPGRIVGHPSVLEGTIAEIASSAAALSRRPGVHGLDLLAYRFNGDVPALIARVIEESSVPVVAAGSIDTEQRIHAVSDLGVWGFTIGSAIFDGTFAPGASVRQAVDRVLDIVGASPRTASR